MPPRKKISKLKEEQSDEKKSHSESYALKRLLARRYWGSGLHHNFPEIFPPIRSKDKFPYKTHIISPYFERTLLTDSVGRMAIYFCPATYFFEGLRSGYQDSNLDITYAADAFVYYADHNGSSASGTTVTAFPYNTSALYFNNPSTWHYIRSDSGQAPKFSRHRLLSSYLKLKYMGKVDELSGVIKIGMGFKTFSS